jgi:hypothetical protein
MQSELYHDPARHWDGLHAHERFRPIYPSEAVVRFLLGRFRARLQDGDRLTALDIGVGGGRNTRSLCEIGFDTFGIDVSAEGLKQTEGLLVRLGFKPTLKPARMTDCHSNRTRLTRSSATVFSIIASMMIGIMQPTYVPSHG